MNGFLRLFQYVKDYQSLLVLHIASTILMVLFNTLSFVLSEPFLKILFERTALHLKPVARVVDLDSMVAYAQLRLNDFVVTKGQMWTLVMVCLVSVGVFFLKNLFRYLSVLAITPVRFGVMRDLRKRLFDKLLSLPLAYFSEERRGDLVGRMITDVMEVQQSVLSAFEVVVREPLMIFASLAVMLYISPPLTLLAFFLILVVTFVIGGVGKRLKRQSRDAQSKLGELISIIDESIAGLRIIKAFNAQPYQQEKFSRQNEKHRAMMTHIHWRVGASSPLSEFLGIVIVVVLLWYGGVLVFKGDFLTESFLLFLIMFYNMIGPAKSIAGAYYNIQKGLGATERIDAVMGTQSHIQELPNAKILANFSQGIHYQGVSFSYEEGRQVLRDITLHIPKGKLIAIVGASGSGKSTLADLLPRFHDVDEGEILIDGINIKQFTLQSLQSQIGIVSQTPILFNDTIYNNITFGMEHVTEAQVIAAAKVAHAHDFISTTERGYQTVIGDGGIKLSGGQRQRITIARAILRNPPILILDEATSSLDSESERYVQDALTVLMQHRTSIVIAHRLSTIQHADEIIVMQDGIIVERGTHESLFAKDGFYTRLVALQKL